MREIEFISTRHERYTSHELQYAHLAAEVVSLARAVGTSHVSAITSSMPPVVPASATAQTNQEAVQMR